MRNLTSIIKAAVLTFTLLATARHVCAASVSLNPTADAAVGTGIANSLAGTNYGGAGSLAVSAASLPKGEFQSVLRFDTSSAKSAFDTQYGPGGWSIQSVTLQLSAGTVNNTNFNANAAGSFNIRWMQNDSWTEGSGTPSSPTATGITYNSLLATFVTPGTDELLGTFAYNGSSSGTFSYNLTLTPGFTSDLLAGNLAGFQLDAADSAVSYFFSSRSFGTAPNRPLLTITAVPEPGTFTLLALGGGLFAMFVRRKSRV